MGKRSKDDPVTDDAGAGARSGRKRLAKVIASLDKARAKRDKAQARVEALEALAEGLAERLAAEATIAAELTLATESTPDGASAPADGSAGPAGGDPAAEVAISPTKQARRRG